MKEILDVRYCTMRSTTTDLGEDATDIECRFTNEEKYSLCTITEEHDNITSFLCDCLNNKELVLKLLKERKNGH